MSRIMVSEGYTWVGRKPTLELEILAFSIRELVPDISDDDVQRLLEIRDEKKAHELQSMITTESNSWKTPWTLTRSEIWSTSSWLLRNQRRQRSAHRAMYPELLQKRETCQSPHQRARPLQVSQQLAAISWQRGERSRRITGSCSRE